MYTQKVTEVPHPVWPVERDEFCPESHHDLESLGLEQAPMPGSVDGPDTKVER